MITVTLTENFELHVRTVDSPGGVLGSTSVPALLIAVDFGELKVAVVQDGVRTALLGQLARVTLVPDDLRGGVPGCSTREGDLVAEDGGHVVRGLEDHGHA